MRDEHTCTRVFLSRNKPSEEFLAACGEEDGFNESREHIICVEADFKNGSGDSMRFTDVKDQAAAQNQDHVREKESHEKDIKLDWSATKKIQCSTTTPRMSFKCGSVLTYVNLACQEDYKYSFAHRLTMMLRGQMLIV